MTSDNQHNEKEIDQHSGVETTGHEWDGIKELNNPAPRWWLWIFFICCIWAFGYWVIYPAWPTLSGEGIRGGTTGNAGWTQYNQLQSEQAEIVARRSEYLTEFRTRSIDEIMQDPSLYAFAIAGGKSSFKDNCATCHGTGGAGAKGYPNLNDDDWLWGGSPEDIYQTIRYGVRSDHEDTRISQMPNFGELLTNQQILSISQYVYQLSHKGQYPVEGAALYQEQCASCHGTNGKGNQELGAPNLSDSIWFYSEGDEQSIFSQIKQPKHGMMPSWENRLDNDTIRQLSIYVHSLGGGQ